MPGDERRVGEGVLERAARVGPVAAVQHRRVRQVGVGLTAAHRTDRGAGHRHPPAAGPVGGEAQRQPVAPRPQVPEGERTGDRERRGDDVVGGVPAVDVQRQDRRLTALDRPGHAGRGGRHVDQGLARVGRTERDRTGVTSVDDRRARRRGGRDRQPGRGRHTSEHGGTGQQDSSHRSLQGAAWTHEASSPPEAPSTITAAVSVIFTGRSVPRHEGRQRTTSRMPARIEARSASSVIGCPSPSTT